VLPPRRLGFQLVARDQSSLRTLDDRVAPPVRIEPFYDPNGSVPRIVGPRPDVAALLTGLPPEIGRNVAVQCDDGSDRGAGRPGDPSGNAEDCSPWILEPVALENRHVREASVAVDREMRRPYVSVELTPEGARRFEQLTAENIHRRLAIVIDGAIMSSPVIQSRIPGGHVQITLGAGASAEQMEREAHGLAAALSSGALSAPWQIASERMEAE